MRIPIASGIAQQLQEIFPGEPMMAVEKAAADGLIRALGDEGIGLSEVVCNRDYAKLCPQGRQYFWPKAVHEPVHYLSAGWADTGDGMTCAAPENYQGATLMHTHCKK